MINKVPTNQDIFSAVKDLSKLVGTMAIDITGMQGNIMTLKSDVSTLKSDVSTLKSDVAEIKETLERHERKIDLLAAKTSTSFSSFTSGALVA